MKVNFLSVVIPVFNEAQSLRPLCAELIEVLPKVSEFYEVLIIDDGSTDETSTIVQSLEKENTSFKVIRLRKNFGKSVALSRGFQEAKGDVIVTLDGDLQDDPNEIPKLLEKLEEGYDLISGWKQNRQDPFLKKHSSKLFNQVTALFSGLKLHDFNCGLKCYRKVVVGDLKLYGQLHRFIPVLAYGKGFRIGEVAVRHRRRTYGRTKYGPVRYLEGIFDLFTVLLLTKYIKRPLHFLGRPGLVMGGVGFLICSYLSFLWFMGHRPIGNRPLLFFGILLILSGIQIFCVGLLGELITYTFHQNESNTSSKEEKVSEETGVI